jgi:hypothetical protein
MGTRYWSGCVGSYVILVNISESQGLDETAALAPEAETS